MRENLIEYLLFQEITRENLFFSELYKYENPSKLLEVIELCYKKSNEHFQIILLKSLEKILLYGLNNRKREIRFYNKLLEFYRSQKEIKKNKTLPNYLVNLYEKWLVKSLK